MPSVFDEIFAEAAVPALMETLGTTAIRYHEPEHDPVTLTAIVGHTDVAEEDGASSNGRRKVARRCVTVTIDPDSDYGGVEIPRLSGDFEIDGEMWAIKGIESQTASLVKFECERKTSVEVSRSGYRGR